MTLASGWCLTRRHGDACRSSSCTCDCHAGSSRPWGRPEPPTPPTGPPRVGDAGVTWAGQGALL